MRLHLLRPNDSETCGLTQILSSWLPQDEPKHRPSSPLRPLSRPVSHATRLSFRPPNAPLWPLAPPAPPAPGFCVRLPSGPPPWVTSFPPRVRAPEGSSSWPPLAPEALP